MAGKDDAEEKKFAPSAQRLRKLREDGQIAKSGDVPVVASLAAIFIYLMATFTPTRDRLAAAFAPALDDAGLSFADRLGPAMSASGAVLAWTVLPVFAVAFVAYAVAAIADMRGIPMSAKSITPKFDKFNPVEGIKKLVKLQSLIDLAKNLVKLLLLVAAMAYVLRGRMNDIFWAPTCGAVCTYPLALKVFSDAIVAGLLVLLLMAIIDYKVARLMFLKDNKMTLTEMKKENKESEGTPELKQERRRIMQEGATTKVVRGGDKATIVILSGEGAVGLYYEDGIVPVVVAKCYGKEAAELVQSARGKGVPMAVDDEAVMVLMRDGRVGRPISEANFGPVVRAFQAAGYSG